MAKRRRRVSKSKRIREYREQNPKATGAEIVRELKKQRVKVTPALVYNVIHIDRRRKNGSSVALVAAAQTLLSGMRSLRDAERFLGRIHWATSVLRRIIKHPTPEKLQVLLDFCP